MRSCGAEEDRKNTISLSWQTHCVAKSSIRVQGIRCAGCGGEQKATNAQVTGAGTAKSGVAWYRVVVELALHDRILATDRFETRDRAFACGTPS